MENCCGVRTVMAKMKRVENDTIKIVYILSLRHVHTWFDLWTNRLRIGKTVELSKKIGKRTEHAGSTSDDQTRHCIGEA